MPEPLSVAMVTGGLAGLAVRYARTRYAILKDAFDVTVSILLLLAALPVMAICAAIIKLSDPRGPVLFSQTRVGLGGRRFRMYKLRTMYTDAEKDTGAVWATDDDPRVIPLCRFMRLSHLDELPQLYNILRGDMSLVGPRPERPEIIRELMMHIPNYMNRLEVKPGLTGLAQIENGYDSDIDSVRRKVAWDLEYVRTRGWATDLKILGRTILMITGKGRDERSRSPQRPARQICFGCQLRAEIGAFVVAGISQELFFRAAGALPFRGASGQIGHRRERCAKHAGGRLWHAGNGSSSRRRS